MEEAARGSVLSKCCGVPAVGGWPRKCTAWLLGISPCLLCKPVQAGIYRDAIYKAFMGKEKEVSWFDWCRLLGS